MVLITGATGLLGGHLLMQLCRDGETVRALIRKPANFDQLKIIAAYYELNWSDIHKSVDWVYGDMLDEQSLNEACENISVLYHCAAVVSFDGVDAGRLNEINVTGTKLICKAALKHQINSFCMISSIAAVGSFPDKNQPADERCLKEECEAGSDYSLSKFRSEEIVWQYEKEGLPAVIVNPGVILGAGLMNKGSMKIFETAMKGMPFYTEGGTGYVDVRDVVKAVRILTSRHVKGERYILVSGNITYGQLFFMIADATGCRRPFIKAGKPVLAVAGALSAFIQMITRRQMKYTRSVLLAALTRKSYSSDKIRREFGFEFISLSDTINDIAGFLKRIKK